MEIVMLHAARQLPSWLTYNVRQKRMTYEQLTTGYLAGGAVLSFGSIGWLAFKHRAHINFTVVRAAMLERKRPNIPADAQARWDRDATIVGRFGWVFIGGWLLIMLFGRAITTG